MGLHAALTWLDREGYSVARYNDTELTVNAQQGGMWSTHIGLWAGPTCVNRVAAKSEVERFLMDVGGM